MASYLLPVITKISWQQPVKDKDLTSPPGSPNKGDRYIIGTPADTGDWYGHENDIVTYDGSSWMYATPSEGWMVWVEDENLYYQYSGTSWVKLDSILDHGNLSGLSDDDHPQYILADGSRAFTNPVSGVTPTSDDHLATFSGLMKLLMLVVIIVRVNI